MSRSLLQKNLRCGILKKGQSFDEQRYQSSLEEMLRQSIDYEDDHYIRTE